jgi:hypothetical protein
VRHPVGLPNNTALFAISRRNSSLPCPFSPLQIDRDACASAPSPDHQSVTVPFMQVIPSLLTTRTSVFFPELSALIITL